MATNREDENMNPHSIGNRVQWTREVYRMPIKKRPVDTGTVVAVDGLFVTVKADHDGSEVRGPWVAFGSEAVDSFDPACPEHGDPRPDPELKTYSILYSYPTWDKNYRGQRGERIAATSEQDALERIRSGGGHYGPCPDARIVRCKVAAVQPEPTNNDGLYGGECRETPPEQARARRLESNRGVDAKRDEYGGQHYDEEDGVAYFTIQTQDGYEGEYESKEEAEHERRVRFGNRALAHPIVRVIQKTSEQNRPDPTPERRAAVREAFGSEKYDLEARVREQS